MTHIATSVGEALVSTDDISPTGDRADRGRHGDTVTPPRSAASRLLDLSSEAHSIPSRYLLGFIEILPHHDLRCTTFLIIIISITFVLGLSL
ncbi:hypothetical protein DPEC_G00151000 [Dallia pectoralis]|uniref:Uncharacterized protein n=1 Tax=Dallia pectoralis TaxID=75939 RepID=A0ACC2GJL0_DALPE|nr:hypothetical protein DPEC_G00151000 [Dallia pectoralis]